MDGAQFTLTLYAEAQQFSTFIPSFGFLLQLFAIFTNKFKYADYKSRYLLSAF